MTITVLLADDHVLFRQGLALLVREQRGWEIVGEAGDGAEAVALAQARRPQIAVLDVEMPGVNGIEAARRIRQVSPETRVVALSMYGDAYYQQQMFAAGASAYVLKSEAIADLVDAIQVALRGERFISPAVIQHGAPIPARSAELDKRVLSDREIEVLRLLTEGRRTREIAEGLDISVKTVETYRGRIMLKLGIDNLAELVKFAIRAGITSTEL
ncbi:MAG: response regulator transcription factor [Candidatus Contendobacter sp.]|nr:response regulator transcription factor [Candidatus Contendobacter sp.]MDG4557168.1 response regulator transcription factor [Candidatus Contendobacter sp.]